MILVGQQSYSELRALPDLVAELAGFGVGVVLSLLLLWLVARSPERRKLPQSFMGVCALGWNLGGLLKFAALLIAWHEPLRLIGITNAMVFSIAGIWPAAAIAVWLDNVPSSAGGSKPGGRWLLHFSIASGALIALTQFVQLWTTFRPLQSGVWQEMLQSELIRESPAYNGLFVIGAGAWFLLRRQRLTRLQKVAVSAILAGIGINIATITAHAYFRLGPSINQAALVLKHQSILLVVIGSLFYLACFRSLDVFVKVGLRVLVAAAVAVVASCVALGVLRAMAGKTAAPEAFAVVTVAFMTAAVALLVQACAPRIDAFVERQILCKPDYRLASNQLREQLADLVTRAEVLAATERFVRDTLELRVAQILSREVLEERAKNAQKYSSSGSAATNYGADIAVPVVVSNRPEYVLQLVRREPQDTLITLDLDFARAAAEIAGRRLEALDRETERIERARHEADLVHQLVSAQLRALRAQVNPHFLFNALNTIAALIPPEPEKAELMTVRLAKVFRHVLTHADRSFSPVEEEMEFLRTYLEIEQVRFGDRLKVRFEVAERAAGTIVPSLILQPVVENALKHGLAPKLGNNELVIRALLSEDFLLIFVEDNGVGPRSASDPKAASTGLGLRNVEERLRTIYGGRATLVLEPGPLGGSRAILQIPAAGAAA